MLIVVLAVVALWAIARLVVSASALADSRLVLLVGVVARTAAVAVQAVSPAAEFLMSAAPASPETSSQSTAGCRAVLLIG